MGEPEMSLKSLHLDDLPMFDPPENLWPRIVAERNRRIAGRRRTLVGAALAAGIALLAVALPRMAPQPAAVDHGLVELEQRSHSLEHELAALAADNAAPIESEAELRLIEVALQAAYDRGGAPEEIAPLWHQRNELLSSLIALRAAGGQLTRI
jgi:hypothetical protein